MKNLFKIGLVAVVAGGIGAWVFSWLSPAPQNNYYLKNEGVTAYSSVNNPNSAGGAVDFVEASAKATPSVVYINTVSQQQVNSWFDWYFGGTQQVKGSGSGVIYSQDGYIITNNHVIDNSDKIEVVYKKRSYAATVVGTDPSTDLAVLKIDVSNLPAIELGSSAQLKIGEWVLAVGNPFNLNSTVTAGIVSAKGRNIHIVNSQFPIESFIQTDAAINPGNSGGALVNARGELIGINTAILSKTGSYTGYGFAVPVDIVKKIVKDMIKYGEVQKAFVGAEVDELNSALGDKLGIKELDGVWVSYIQKDGAAEKIGLQKGDIIVKLNDYVVDSKSDFDEYISYFSPGDKIKVSYKRENKLKEGTVVLTNREGTTEVLKRETVKSNTLGADFEVVSKVEKDKMGITNGVRILNVRSGLVARMGLKEGFVITSINRAPIATAEEAIEILEKIRGRVIIEGITQNGQKGFYSFYF